MAPWVVERLPEHNHYVEVFAGSAAIMAIKPPVDAETLNDTYDEVVNFFRVLRQPTLASQLIDRVAFTPYSLSEFRDALETDYSSPVNRAWAFFVRMQMAVVPGRTGWSYGVKGPSAKKANKPGRWATMPELLQLTTQRFDRVQVTDWDACDLIERLDAPGVLFFCDPPYLDDSRPTSTGTSSAYVEDSLDHDQFLKALFNTEHASFAVTHYPHPTYDELEWTRVEDYESHRNIPNGDGRDKQTERLYIYDRTTH
jgi:DNA adenine methylase